MTLPEVIRAVLTQPMTQTGPAVRVLELGRIRLEKDELRWRGWRIRPLSNRQNDYLTRDAGR
jgi:hypothetical protein